MTQPKFTSVQLRMVPKVERKFGCALTQMMTKKVVC